MGNLIIEEVPLPQATKGAKKGSAYLNDDIIEAANQLAVGNQSFAVPTLEGKTPEKMLANVPWYLNLLAKENVTAEQPEPKKFIARIMDGKVRIWRKA
jgi:hypothetical protein